MRLQDILIHHSISLATSIQKDFRLLTDVTVIPISNYDDDDDDNDDNDNNDCKNNKKTNNTLVPPSTPHVPLSSWNKNNVLTLKLSTKLSQRLLEALRYRSEGRAFDSRRRHWDFSLT